MKRALSVLLTAAMAASMMAGCGSSSDGAASGTTTDNGAAAGTESAGAAAADGAAFKIGGIGPTTGAAAIYGTAVMNGAQIAVDEINAAGGINGYQIDYNFQDDEHDAEKAVNAYNKLKDSGMQILMGTVTSTPCKAVKDNAHDDNMFLLTPSGSAVECTKYDNAFRICFNNPDQGTASARYIKENSLATKVAAVYDSSDVYSSGIYEKFAAECKAEGIEVVESQAFTSDNKSDFSVALQKIKDSGAELVFLPIYYQEAALILKQADTAGLDVKFFGCDGLDGVISQLKDDAALANGVMLLTPFAADAKDDKTVKFTAAYKAAYNDETPDQFAADGYDAVYTIKAALEKANVTDANISASDLCNKLKAVMTEITVDGVTGSMTWNAEGEPTKEPKAMYIQDGAYKAMD